MWGRFDDRVAIVTGASRGIGFDIARRLVREGARVAITARNEQELAAAAEALGGSDHALAVSGRGDDPAHRVDTVAKALAHFGRIDMLVNNVGINPVYGDLIDLDLDAARKVLEVNVLSALAWTQQVHRAWLGAHGGAIVNVASVAGLRPPPKIGFYGTSKAALIQLTEQLALELAPAVRVNAVAPAVVKTQFAEALYEGHEAELAARYPLARLGEPKDVSGVVAFLLSDEASWVTGHTVAVDGGILLMGGG